MYYCSLRDLLLGVGEFNSSVLSKEYDGNCDVKGCGSQFITLNYSYEKHFTFSVSGCVCVHTHVCTCVQCMCICVGVVVYHECS